MSIYQEKMNGSVINIQNSTVSGNELVLLNMELSFWITKEKDQEEV